MNFIIAVGVTFGAIAIVAVVLVVVVQSAFGRDFKSGAGRAISFAAWVVNALRTQAQIGRTASSGQPAVIEHWYRFLLIFEANPSGARPSQCTSSMAVYPVVVMSISIACALLFALLGAPCVRGGLTIAARAVIDAARAAVDAVRGGAPSEEEEETRSEEEVEAISAVFGIRRTGGGASDATAGANPMLQRSTREAGGVELTEMRPPRGRPLSLADSTRVSAKRALAAHRLELAGAAAVEQAAVNEKKCCRRRAAPKTRSSDVVGADPPAKKKTTGAVRCIFFYRYISRESCSQFDSLPLTSFDSSREEEDRLGGDDRGPGAQVDRRLRHGAPPRRREQGVPVDLLRAHCGGRAVRPRH